MKGRVEPSYTGAMFPMKQVVPVLVVGFLCACSSAPSDSPAEGAGGPASEGDPEEMIVARVNGQPVYRGSYQHSLTILRDRLGGRQNSVEEYLNARFSALDGLVANELLYQDAEREGVTVSESELYGELERIGRDKGGVEAFIALMNSFGLTREQAIESVRKRLAVDRYIDETITRHIQADEQEVRAYYDSNLERFREPLRVRVSQIQINCGRNAPADHVEDRRRRAGEILEMIRAGGAFETIAREFSEDRSAALDGDIGIVKKGTTYPELEQAAFALEAGEVSDIVRTDAGFHIIRVTQRSGGAVPGYEAVKDACRRALLDDKKNAQVRAAIDRLRAAADVESYID